MEPIAEFLDDVQMLWLLWRGPLAGGLVCAGGLVAALRWRMTQGALSRAARRR